MRPLLTLPLITVVFSLLLSTTLSAREWTDATGEFKVEGDLVEVADGNAKLLLSDGREISVPIQKLSKADQDFIERSSRHVSAEDVAEAETLVGEAIALIQLDARANARVIDEKLEAATRINPTSIHAEFIRGVYHLLVTSEPAQASRCFELCLKREPNNPAVLANAGLARLKARSFATALEHFEKAVELDPDSRAIAQNLGRALMVHKDKRLELPNRIADKFAELYAKIVAREQAPPSTPELGWMLVKLKQTKSVSEGSQKVAGDFTSGGTGFVVSGDYLVTNRHVVKDASAIKILVPGADKKSLPVAKVIAISDEADVAILHCEGLSLPAAPIVTDVPRRGSDVMVLGFPQFSELGTSIKSTRGAVTSIPSADTDNMLLLDAEMNSGNSGGPIANKQGEVVAIATAVFKPTGGTGGRYGAGIPISTQQEFLKKHIPKFAVEQAERPEIDWPDVDEVVSKSTVLVLVAGGVSNFSVEHSDVIFDPTCPACSGSGEVDVRRESMRCPHCRGLGADLIAAVAIARRMDSGRKENPSLPAPDLDDSRITIFSAVYGINQSFFDVTEKMRELAHGKQKWETTVGNGDFGDPAPGYHLGNTLIVRYAYKGKVGTSITYEGKKVSIPATNLKTDLNPRDEITASGKELHIKAAFYGINQSFWDVTDKVRAKTAGKSEWKTTVTNDDWGDPAPGYHIGNTLIICYEIGGKSYFAKEYEGKQIHLRTH